MPIEKVKAATDILDKNQSMDAAKMGSAEALGKYECTISALRSGKTNVPGVPRVVEDSIGANGLRSGANPYASQAFPNQINHSSLGSMSSSGGRTAPPPERQGNAPPVSFAVMGMASGYRKNYDPNNEVDLKGANPQTVLIGSNNLTVGSAQQQQPSGLAGASSYANVPQANRYTAGAV